MADFEKVPTGHARWPAQWPAVRVRAHACALACPTSARAKRALAWDVARSLRWGTVSDALVLLSPV